VDGRGRILIVDDDVAVRSSLAAVLSDDFDVQLASDARSAEHVISRGVVDAVIADYQMPGMSGIELLDRLRRSHPEIVVMLLTGHTDLPEVKAAQRDGRIFRVLVKPYNPASLLEWAHSAAHTARLRRATRAMSDRLRRL
jgi:DNA-binding NtrC family response regulator